jgi:Tol biopolymer transport system component
MRQSRRSWPAAALAAALALLALPAAAQATLAYVKVPLHTVVYAAADNGSGVKRVGRGSAPRVSPDGKQVVYLHEGKSRVQELNVAPATGGAGRTLMRNWRNSFYLAFSPDSSKIAALRGPEVGTQKLVVIDLSTGTQRVVAGGTFSGFSFSPDGEEIVYARAPRENFPLRSDLYRVSAAGGKPRRLTKDHRSQDPLWGPQGTIVFVRQLGGKQRRYGPKNELFTMSPNGGRVRRLTHTTVDPLLLGLFPTEWSADGSRLLAEFEGQDTSYAVAVNPGTGAQRPLDKAGGGGEQGFVGAALSNDGSTVLGSTGGFDPGIGHDVATIPYGGGRAKVLVKNAFEPDWNG